MEYYQPSDTWRYLEEIKHQQAIQAQQFEAFALGHVEHDRRLERLEQWKNEEMSKPRNMWAPQKVPDLVNSSLLGHSQAIPHGNDMFSSFDQSDQHLIADLRLDEDSEPRRGASRANSVRFDESATQAHWPTTDYFLGRSSSRLGGHPMDERSASYKSDGRHSSMRSEAQSFFDTNLDQPSSAIGTPYLHPTTGTSSRAVQQRPLLSGVIVCFDAKEREPGYLHHAVICSSTMKSRIGAGLLSKYGLRNKIQNGANGESEIETCLYLPGTREARQGGAQSQRQTTQLSVKFSVIDNDDSDELILGSNILTSSEAEISFMRNEVALYVDDGRRMMIPFDNRQAGGQQCETHKSSVRSSLSVQVSEALGKHHRESNVGSSVGDDSGVSLDGRSRSRASLVSTSPTIESPTESMSAKNHSKLQQTEKADSQRPAQLSLDTEAAAGTSSKLNITVADVPTGTTPVVSPSSADADSSIGDGRDGPDGLRSYGPRFPDRRIKDDPSHIWDSWRKKRDDKAERPQREVRGGQRGGRSMKVLRPAKAGSFGESRGSIGGDGQQYPASPVLEQKTSPVDSMIPIQRVQSEVARKVSRPSLPTEKSNGNLSPLLNGGHRPSHVKQKSGNVVGGGSAFAWMN